MKAEHSQVDRLKTLIEVSKSLTSGLNLDEIIHEILVAAIRAIPGADAGVLFLYDPRLKKLVVSHSVGIGPPADEIKLKPGEGMSGRAFLSGKPSIYLDPHAAATGMSNVSKRDRERFRQATGGIGAPPSALSAPLIYKGQPIGAFVVENLHVAQVFDSFDLDIVDALAQVAAAAIVNARLFESERAARVGLESLNAEIRIQRDQLQRRIDSQESLAEVVKEGLPLSALATCLARLTQGSVVILDALNRVRACDPQLEIETARGLDWLPPDQFVAWLDRTSNMRTRQRISAPLGEIVLSPIVGGGEVLGFIGVKGEERGLDAVDETAADSAALVAAAEFLKERGIEESEIRDRSDLLEELLQGRIPPRATSVSALKPPLRLAVGVLRNLKARGQIPDVRVFRMFVAVTQEAVERSQALALVTVREQYVAVIWSLSGETVSNMEDDLVTVSAKLERISPEWRATFGISDRTEQLDRLAATYNELRVGLEVRQELGRYSPVFRIGDLGAYQFILQSASGDQVSEFCQRALGAVIEHDGRRGGNLLLTFRTYVNEGSSVKGTAEELGIHPHTVQYRLDRLQAITGLSLRRPEERLTLEMALRVMDALKILDAPNGVSGKSGRSPIASPYPSE